jgi:hypothetical protein
MPKERYERPRYNIEGLGQIYLKTLALLIDKGWIEVKLKSELTEQFKEFDSIIIDDKNDKIIIKGIKKLLEL